MRYETINGNKVVCGHIFDATELKVGQRWTQANGDDRIVTIRALEPYDPSDLQYISVIYGYYGNDTTYEKDVFSFQCRYCLIIEEK